MSKAEPTAEEMFGPPSGTAVEGTIPIDPCSGYRPRPRFRRSSSGRPYVIPGSVEPRETELPANYYQEEENDMPSTAMIASASDTMARPVTNDELALIKTTVAVGATDAELKLFLFDCARQGVHPLDRLIHFTKRSGKYTPITSIDFMRQRAAETGEMAGSDDPVFHPHALGATGVGHMDIESATVTVYRLTQGQRFAYSATARWDEYKPEQNDFMWRKMPHTMLGKCAEALALRKGFPRQLAGLYAKEEMDQAGTEPVIQIRDASTQGTIETYGVPGQVAWTGPKTPAPTGEREKPAAATVEDRGTSPSRVPGEDDDLPQGAVRIARIGPGKGGAPAEITLSTGEAYLVWKEAVLKVARECHAAGAAVAIDLKTSQSGNTRIEAITPVVF